MSCDHLIYSPTDQAHILPCRHKFCIPCIENIEGLMESDIFSCPVCGNYSQYVDPRRKVFGEEKPEENEYERMDYNTSPGNMPENTQADSYSGGAATTARRSMSDREDGRDPDRDFNAWVKAQTGVQKQTFEIEQREAMEKIERDNQYKRQSTTPEAASRVSQVSTSAMNDARGSPNDHGSDSLKTRDRSSVKSERYANYDNAWKEHTSTESNLTKRYDEEGRCLLHKRFIAFSCKECNILLCELCRSSHAMEYYHHTISRLKEEEQHNTPPKKTSGSVDDSVATVSNDKECKHHFKPYIMYCKSSNCKRMLCHSCLETHSKYCVLGEPVSLRDMRQNMYTTFSEHLDTIDGLKRKLESVSQTAEHNVACLLEEADTLKEKVKKATEEAVQQLRDNQETMMEQVDSEVKRETTKHQTCADEANKIIDTLKPLVETAQGTLKSVEDSNFAVAQIAEQDVSQYISDLKRKMSYRPKDYEPPSREHIPLRCEFKRISRYYKYDGDRSEAPVRLNKPTSSFSQIANFYSVYF